MIRPVHSFSVLAAASAAVLLAACGGGGGADAPAAQAQPAVLTAAGTSTVSGTVTGFGSVIVDGVRIDDSAVAAGKEQEDGTVTAVELKLGQHVEVQHDGNRVASRIRVSSEVEGAVTAIDVPASTFIVVGQTVVSNKDAALGPVTVFAAPYTALDDVKAADLVEVHALVKTDSAGKVTLQATRVEKKVADGADRVNGFVGDLSSTAHTFKLGGQLIDYSSAKLLPAGIVLANGMEVHVALPVGTTASTAAVKAVVVNVQDRRVESQGKEAELGGAIGSIDSVTKILTINGVKVDFSAITFNQPGRGLADLKSGAYVVIKGTFGSTGRLKATTVVIRGTEEDRDKQAELHGTILNFNSMADFTVRGVPVDASHATIDLASCLSTKLANEMQVSATGTLTASGRVILNAIVCEKAQDGQTVVERQGIASKLDVATKSFTLTTPKEPLSVRWTATTTFVDVEAATLAGKYLDVQGSVASGVLTARKISLHK